MASRIGRSVSNVYKKSVIVIICNCINDQFLSVLTLVFYKSAVLLIVYVVNEFVE